MGVETDREVGWVKKRFQGRGFQDGGHDQCSSEFSLKKKCALQATSRPVFTFIRMLYQERRQAF